MVQLEEKKEEKRWFNKMETEEKTPKETQNVCIKTRVLVLCTLTNELQS